MKKVFAFIFTLILACIPIVSVSASGATGADQSPVQCLAPFTDNFEQYQVSGEPIENDKVITQKWENNVFKGGEPVGMDSHIYNVGHIEYESGQSGNKVLHLKNTSGADSFFYMGPAGEYRTKNFTVSFKLRFLAQDVAVRSWVGISFRKKAQVHYTGTNGLMFVAQRDVNATGIGGSAFAVFSGGEPSDLSRTSGLYGDKLSISQKPYEVAGASANNDMPWVTYKLTVSDSNYKLYINDSLIVDCTFDVPSFDYYGYLSLNCCAANVLIDDFDLQTDGSLPPQVLPLATPQVQLNAEQKRLVWQEIDGATAYIVKADEQNQFTVYTNFFNIDRIQKAGSYQITVTAVSDDAFFHKDSLPSEPVQVEIAGNSGGESGGTEGANSGESGSGCASITQGTLSVFAVCIVAVSVIIKRKVKG